MLRPDTRPSPDASLRDACARGDASEIERALARGALLEAHDDASGHTPLRLAACFASASAARALIAAGARVDALGPDGLSASMLACRWGAADALRALLDAGADPNLRAGTGATPLIVACESSALDCAQELLARGALPNLADSKGRAPLHAAIPLADSFGGLVLVLSLLDAGADPFAGDRRGVCAHRLAIDLGMAFVAQSMAPRLAAAERRAISDLCGSAFPHASGGRL